MSTIRVGDPVVAPQHRLLVADDPDMEFVITACTLPGSVEPPPGAKLRLVRRLDRSHGLYLEEQYLPAEPELPDTESRDRNRDK